MADENMFSCRVHEMNELPIPYQMRMPHNRAVADGCHPDDHRSGGAWSLPVKCARPKLGRTRFLFAPRHTPSCPILSNFFHFTPYRH